MATKAKQTKKKPNNKPVKKQAEIKSGLKIKNWNDVCAFHKLDPKNLPDVSSFPESMREYILNMFKAVMITSAINDNWVPDWNNWSEYKYRLRFGIEADKDHPSGFGFSDTDCVSAVSTTFVGSRLLFSSSEKALHAAKQFPDVYKAIILI